MYYFGLEIELRNKIYREAKQISIAEFLNNNYLVYRSRLFDKNIDFIVKIGNEFYEIQIVIIKIKSSFVYTSKDSLFEPKNNRWIYLFLFPDTNEFPNMFFISSKILSKTNVIFKDIGNHWCIDFSPQNIERLKEIYGVEQFWNMCRTRQMFHEAKEHNKPYNYQEREPNEDDYFQELEDDDIWER